MPTNRKAKKIILNLLASLSEETIFELGSGWGSLIFPLAKCFPKKKIYAYELSWIPWFFSCISQKILRYPNLLIERKNFFNISFNEASIVVCYLYPKAMERLKEKFTKELRPGSLVITNTFAIPGWTPKCIHDVKDAFQTKIYFYVA